MVCDEWWRRVSEKTAPLPKSYQVKVMGGSLSASTTQITTRPGNNEQWQQSAKCKFVLRRRSVQADGESLEG